jgi:hypothetical protein
MMNELSNKILTHVSGLNDFFTKKTSKGEMLKYNQLDFKIFTQFDMNNEKKSNSLSSKASSLNICNYSLRDLLYLSTENLSQKVFTFDKDNEQKDLSSNSID